MTEHLFLTLAQDEPPPPPPAVATEAPATTTTTAPPGAPQPQHQPQGFGGGGSLWIILLVAMVLMLLFSIRGQSKEKKKRQAMLEALKKGDRIQTVGGILGTITEVRPDQVIVKVDENANVKLHFARSAIQSVIQSKDQD